MHDFGIIQRKIRQKSHVPCWSNYAQHRCYLVIVKLQCGAATGRTCCRWNRAGCGASLLQEHKIGGADLTQLIVSNVIMWQSEISPNHIRGRLVASALSFLILEQVRQGSQHQYLMLTTNSVNRILARVRHCWLQEQLIVALSYGECS